MQDQVEHLTEELANFHEIASLLNPSPGELPELAGIDICGLSMPLRDALGGDHTVYVDFKKRYDLPARIAEARAAGRTEVVEKLTTLEHRAGILVADVSGHRRTDALVAAMLHQAFLLGVNYELDLSGQVTTRLFEHLNTRFHLSTRINKYVTMIYGEITDKGTLRFLSAGHQPPEVFSREFGRFVSISKDHLVSFPPLGMFASSGDPDGRLHREPLPSKQRYRINEISLLSPGDILLLYTDGLREHGPGRYFPDRLEPLLAEARSDSAAEICERIREDVRAAGPQEDDVSVVVIRRVAATKRTVPGTDRA